MTISTQFSQGNVGLDPMIWTAFKQSDPIHLSADESNGKVPKAYEGAKRESKIGLKFNAKKPGPEMTLDAVAMDFRYKDWFHQAPAVGYETLLYDCMHGDATLFQRADMVELGWNLVAPVQTAWQDPATPGPEEYPAGSWGPFAASELIARDGRQWREEAPCP